jgi:uncharacterized protein (TIGR04255 family)
LWNKFKPNYANSREAPPLFPVIEQFDEDSPKEKFPFGDEFPSPRVWFETADGNGLIQVQRDRFLHNWKKEKDSDKYPHYNSVIANFRSCLAVFEGFLEEQKLGDLQPTQYELTYINHIFKGEGWETLDELGNIFQDFFWGRGGKRFLPRPESINWLTSFILPDRSGRLRVSIRLGKRTTDRVPAILLELTARGMSSDPSRSSMWSWFDMAHEWIACGFVDLTSEKIQKTLWRRTR